jgi:iron uptake system component EfeO
VTQHIAGAAARFGAAVAGLALLAGCASHRSAPSSSGPAATALTLDRGTCAPQWTHPRGGTQTYALTNVTIAGAEAYLENADTGAVYADFESIGTQATLSLTVTLGDGNYRFVCLSADEDPIQGATVTIKGSGVTKGLTPGVEPVTNNDLLDITKSYESWVSAQLPALVADTAALNNAVAAGDLSGAPALWLTAHLDYERLGAAYGSFGDLDGAINGTADGLPSGVDDPGLTGFHRIEYLLWHGGSAADIATYTSQLLADVTQLQTEFATAQIDTLDIGLRAHEIMENAIEFELTGRTDYGSGTNLATIDANITGDRELVTLLRPLLSSRMSLDGVDSWLDTSQALISAQHHSDGSWVPLSALTQPDREKINSALSELTEQLAPIAAITDIRREG